MGASKDNTEFGSANIKCPISVKSNSSSLKGPSILKTTPPKPFRFQTDERSLLKASKAERISNQVKGKDEDLINKQAKKTIRTTTATQPFRFRTEERSYMRAAQAGQFQQLKDKELVVQKQRKTQEEKLMPHAAKKKAGKRVVVNERTKVDGAKRAPIHENDVITEMADANNVCVVVNERTEVEGAKRAPSQENDEITEMDAAANDVSSALMSLKILNERAENENVDSRLQKLGDDTHDADAENGDDTHDDDAENGDGSKLLDRIYVNPLKPEEKLMRDIPALESKVETLLTEMTILSAHLAFPQDALKEDAIRDLSAAQMRIQTLESEKIQMQDSLKSALQALHENERELECRVHEFESQHEELMQLLYMEAFERGKQEVVSEDTYNDLMAAELMIGTLEAQKNDQQVRLESALQRAEDKERHLVSSTAQNAVLELKYAELQAEMESLCKKMEFERKEMSISLESALKKLEEKDLELQEAKSVNEAAALQNVHLLADMEVLRNQVEMKEALKEDVIVDLSAAEMRIQTLESEKIQMQNSLKSAVQMIHENEMELECRVHEFESQHEEMMELYLAALERGQQEVVNEEIHSDLMAAEMKIKTLEAQKNDQKVHLKSALQRAEDKERQLVASSAQNAVLELKYAELQAEMESLRKEMEYILQGKEQNEKLLWAEQKAKQDRKELHELGKRQRNEILKVLKSAAANEGRREFNQESLQNCNVGSKFKVAKDEDITHDEIAHVELKRTLAKEREEILHSCEDGAVREDLVLPLKEQNEKLLRAEQKVKQDRKELHELGKRQRNEILKVLKSAAANEGIRGLHKKSLQNCNDGKKLEVATGMTDTSQVSIKNVADEKQYAEVVDNSGLKSRRSSEKWGMQVEGYNEEEGEAFNRSLGGYWTESRPDQNRYRRW